MGHCIFDWQFYVLTLLLSVFVFCSMATFIRWSSGSSGWLSHWLFGRSQRRKHYRCPRPNYKHSKRWQRQALPFELISWCCHCSCFAPLGWMALSSLALAQGSIHVGRKDAYVLMSSFHLHVLPCLVMVFAQFVDLMLVCLHQC
jgi:hypothetical protein